MLMHVFFYSVLLPHAAALCLSCRATAAPPRCASPVCDIAKLGIVGPLLEKRWSANLNTWVRAPGILVATVLLYQALLLDAHVVPLWAAYLQLLLPAYNACYFCKQAVANCTSTVPFLTLF